MDKVILELILPPEGHHWSDIEVQPVKVEQGDDCGVVISWDKEPDFWSVYLRGTERTYCVADVSSEQIARDIGKWLMRCSAQFKTINEERKPTLHPVIHPVIEIHQSLE